MAYHLLPTEILVKIFKYLNVADRLCAFLVCKHWYSTCTHRSISGDLVYVLQDDASAGMTVLRDNKRHLRHLTFKEADLTSDTMNFWSNVGSTLTHLKFNSCDIAERLFVDILKHCPRLELLNIIGCNGLFISGTLVEKCLDTESDKLRLPCLTELSLASNRYLSDALFNKLLGIMPNLNRLSIEGCQITFHSAIYKRFYPNGKIQEPSRTVFTFQNIMNYFQKIPGKIKSINLSRTLFDSGSLKNLMLPCPSLDELHLVHCAQLNNSGILHLCNHQPDLKVLDLSLCIQVLDQTLLQICTSLTELHSLKVRSCHHLTDTSISAILQLKKLEEIDVSCCEKLSPAGLKTALLSPTRSNLKTLILSYCNVTDDVVSSITKYATTLTHLDLSYCLALTDSSMHYIAAHLTNLRVLRVAWCKDITDFGLAGEKPDREALAKITLRRRSGLNIPMVTVRSVFLRNGAYGSENMSVNLPTANYSKHGSGKIEDGNDQDEEKEAPFVIGLHNLKGLRLLDLCGCINIGDWGVSKGVTFLDLNYLNLSLCQNLTDEGLRMLGMQNPSVETLILSQCHQLTDQGIMDALSNLTRIRYLDIQGCKNLTNQTLKSVMRNCKDLHHLNITLCGQMTTSAIEAFENEMPRLHSFYK